MPFVMPLHWLKYEEKENVWYFKCAYLILFIVSTINVRLFWLKHEIKNLQVWKIFEIKI